MRSVDSFSLDSFSFVSRLGFIAQTVAVADSIGRAGFHAHAAADALGMIGVFRDVHIHFAGFGTRAAGYALMRIHLHLKQ